MVSFPFPFWAFGTIPFLFWAARSKYSSGSNPQIGLQAVQPDIICHLCIKKIVVLLNLFISCITYDAQVVEQKKLYNLIYAMLHII